MRGGFVVGRGKFPEVIENEEMLDSVMTEPSPLLIEDLTDLDGDFIILGAAGKMGPTLGKLLRRGLDATGSKSKVFAVSRFSRSELIDFFESLAIQPISCDLLEKGALEGLPEAKNILFLAGMKFGATGNEPLTWAMNTLLPAMVAERFSSSRITAVSTGNIYPFTSLSSGGAKESDSPSPVGEYGQSCLGRERMFQYFSEKYQTPLSLIRLFYAIDLRYGVLWDICGRVAVGDPVSLSAGYVNVIWQGDANSHILRSLCFCRVGGEILNVTGPEAVAVRFLATRFGEILGKEPIFTGTESDTALLGDSTKCQDRFGYPAVSLERMIQWTAAWYQRNGSSLGKPTHFETRDGRF